MANYMLDTEFDEDGKTIELISIALVRESDKKSFYRVSSEFRPDHCNDWVKKNVLPHLPPAGEWVSRAQIKDELTAFIGDDDSIAVWAYYGDYDWIVFCQLFGKMVDLPEKYPKLCLDLKQWALMLGVPKAEYPPDPENQHDALADARWNLQLFDFLSNYGKKKTESFAERLETVLNGRKSGDSATESQAK